jgi:hypothetical protein
MPIPCRNSLGRHEPLPPASGGAYREARVGERIEVMRTSSEGDPEPLTQSAPGVHNYHPEPSPDVKRLSFGSDRSGTRQLYIMGSDGGDAYPYSDVPPGSGAKLAHWRPPAEEVRWVDSGHARG